MKSQDIYILLKIVCLQQAGRDHGDQAKFYSARGLSAALGVSKSEVNASIRRSIDIGLLYKGWKSGLPEVARAALLDFVVHGLKYVFPAKLGKLVRGVPTAYSAPVFGGKLLSMGEYGYVWPYAEGSVRGESIEPLFRAVPAAVLKDENLYAYLALVDSIRVGNPREANMAAEMLEERLEKDGWNRRAA